MDILIWFLIVFSGGICLGLVVAPRLDNLSKRKLYEAGVADGRRESNSKIAVLTSCIHTLQQKLKTYQSH